MTKNPLIEIKHWNKNIEKEILEKWQEEWEKLYGFDENAEKIVVIDTPPPYPGPFWHIGAAVSYCYQDFMARAFRMLGFSVLFPLGFDRNGIPVEWYVEKYEKIRMWDVSREEFIKKCSTILDKYCEKMLKIMKDLLFSCDFENVYYTDSEEYRMLTQKTFIEVWKKGLIYEDEKPTNYCPHCKTTIADSEVEYKQKPSKLYYIKFKIDESDQEIIIATTRPELLGACGLIIFNPSDERYKKFEGKNAIVPLYNFKVPIKSRNEADPEFGTGILMVCSFGDLDDVRIFREENIKPRVIIDKEGKMKDEILKGLSVKQAREKIVELLKQKGLIVKEEEIVHNVPVHDKCRTEIEIILTKEYYLNQMDFVDEIEKLAEEIKWHPEFHKQKLKNWISSVKKMKMDWPISRRRYYGTEIPLWYCENCGLVYLPEEVKYYKPWKEKPPIEKCPKCGANNWKGEERILDTWFDSSISLLFITKYHNDKEFFEKIFSKAIKIRPQGYDIIRTWLYYSLLRVFQLTNKRAFDHVLINGMGLDEKGRKMSKSLGNVIYPEEILEEIGAEPLRMWIAMEVVIGNDYRISKEKIKGMTKFLTKLINISRFVSSFPKVDEVENLEASDKWIISETEKLKQKIVEYYENLDFHLAAQELYRFVWDVFASNYIELIKKRAKKGSSSAHFALHYVLKEILKMLAPIIPATTDFIYRKIYGKSVHLQKIEVKKDLIDESLSSLTQKLLEFNSKVWKIKKLKNISLKDPIEIEIPEELKIFEKDLIDCHNIIIK